jgi:hypothetical protein
MQTGYMLFVRIFSRFWNKNEQYELLIWGLKAEYNRNFLGTAAKLWNMLGMGQKHRWNLLANNESIGVLDVALESLDLEMVEHISDVLGLTLVPDRPLPPQ